MTRTIVIIGLACALAAPAFAQAPPQTKPPVLPKAEQNSPDACANGQTMGAGAMSIPASRNRKTRT